MEFQIYDFIENNEVEETDSDEKYPPENYMIHVFGRTADGKDVYCKLTDYTPHFYIKLPTSWKKSIAKEKIKILYKWLVGPDNNKVWKKHKVNLKSITLEERKDAIGFTNGKTYLYGRLVFSNSYSLKNFEKFFTNNKIHLPTLTKKPYQFKLYESNFVSMLRCFHIRNVSGCGWVKINKYQEISVEDKKSYCDIELVSKWTNIEPIEKDFNAPLIIASFDIECHSADGSFPLPEREKDRIIQIGITYTKLGESNPYRQYIACLGKTDDVNETVTECYKTEKDLILGWRDEIVRSKCDIITGWNIFGFDEKYINVRSKMLGIDRQISYLSKLFDHECKFTNCSWASSGTGRNSMELYTTPGRVHIDLMVDIKNDPTKNLPTYKLDFVSSFYIRGNVNKLEFIKLKKQRYSYLLDCDCVDDIFEGDYIHIEHAKHFVSDYINNKYHVDKVDSDKKCITVSSTDIIPDMYIGDNIDIEGCIKWTQAKDDVSPEDMFRLYRGDSSDKSIIAKYCVKDCKLVGLLINKLETVTKSIEMANVCFIPMSYLFLRGQGIKLFSLCLKVYRENGFVFPVLKKEKDNEGYEGAIVFHPVPNIYYDALTVKDYASLYPSSIIQKNMSHETLVMSSDYDDLEGVEYFNAYYKLNDGTIRNVRFAKINGELGIVPNILDTLLKERRFFKKLMEKETDPFKKKILDAKQQALKVTANSLYGQLGAPVSSIFLKAIAACTTSTGREMLIFAKKYDEEILPCFINGLKYAIKNKNEDWINNLFNHELKNPGDEDFRNRIINYVTKEMEKNILQPVVRYGDSVIGKTPLLLKDSDNNYFVDYIENLATEWSQMNDSEKESCELDLMTWTENGWTKVERVIRHKLDVSKKLYKVTTNNGIVVVTDDHSLLNKDGEEVKTNELKVEDTLLHSFAEFTNNVNVSEYILQDNNNRVICSKPKTTGYMFNSKDFTDESRIKVLYDILNSSHEKRKEFISNVMSNIKLPIKFTNKILSQYFYLLISEFYNINLVENDDEIIIEFSDKTDTIDGTIKSIEEYEYEEYVYDLTTENHHFQAGIGCLIVHNTDSVFTSFRFQSGCKKIKKDKALKIWKKIISFSRELLGEFIPDEHKSSWNGLHKKYYGEDKITKLELPEPPKTVDKPRHWKDILPVEDSLKILLKEFMEESYLPWLWTLQEFFNVFNETIKSKMEKKKYRELVENRIWEFGKLQLNKVNVHSVNTMLDIDPTSEEEKDIKKNKEEFEKKIQDFCNNVLKDTVVEVYWQYKDEKKLKVQLWSGGKLISDDKTKDLSIQLGIISGESVKKRLPFPQDLEYEKTYYPIIILTKKKYVGNKYTFDLKKYKEDFMGIVLKRRDNAPIVKEFCEGIINAFITDRNPDKALKFTRKMLSDMFNNKFNINYFSTTKSISKPKEDFANWEGQAHIVLAERIGQRDPGNKPAVGSRLSFVPFVNKNVSKDSLQGERIETPEYIIENKLQVDYLHLVEHQIMNPAMQFLELGCEDAGKLFDHYINIGKLNDIIKEHNELIDEYNKKSSCICDYDSCYCIVDEMDDKMIEDKIKELKSNIRKLKNLHKKLLKTLE